MKGKFLGILIFGMIGMIGRKSVFILLTIYDICQYIIIKLLTIIFFMCI